MIGRINFGVSFRHKLAYCLRQTLRVSEEQEQRVTEERKRSMKQNLAEVIYYNQCCGNKEALVRQFEDVRKQNYNIRKPVLHLVLSLPPGEAVSKSLFVDLARDCARALDFERHQYVAILHKDREHPHVHIVANRIGFDRHTMVNQYTLRRMNQFCRESERRYHLTQVRSIRWYRTPDERNIASEHHRVVKLRETIDRELKQCCTLEELKTRLQVEGYKIYKTNQGIAFKDADRVVIRGYKVGHPWKEIDSVLTENERLRQARVLRVSQRQTMRRRQRLDDQF